MKLLEQNSRNSHNVCRTSCSRQGLSGSYSQDATPARGARAAFDRRRLSKVLLRYFRESNKANRRIRRLWKDRKGEMPIEKND